MRDAFVIIVAALVCYLGACSTTGQRTELADAPGAQMVDEQKTGWLINVWRGIVPVIYSSIPMRPGRC